MNAKEVITKESSMTLQRQQQKNTGVNPSTTNQEAGSPSNGVKASSASKSDRPTMTNAQLEAKRATNRLSARRCRLRQKTLIKDLQGKNSLLAMENKSLRLKLELARAESHRLELVHEQEMNNVLRKSRALQCMAEKRAQEHTPKRRVSTIPSQSATTASALLQLAGQSRTAELVPPSPSPSLADQQRYHEAMLRTVMTASTAPTLGGLPSNQNTTSGLDPPQAGSAGDVINAQKKIERIRDELRGLRHYLTRNSI